MYKSQDLANAISLAAHYHGSDCDKGGQPYILHCLAVMNQVDTIPEKIVAVCHDLLEDTSLSDKGLEQEIGFQLTRQVELLTKPRDVDYFDYIESVIEDESASNKEDAYRGIASKVKMADLRHNLDPLRQPSLGEKDLLRLQKYHRAYKMLRDHREDQGL